MVPVRDETPDVAGNFARFGLDPSCELLIADGGNPDPTRDAFRGIRARVLTAGGTRGARLAAAAQEARGDVLFFVHADSRPPANCLEIVRRTIASGAAAGAFSLKYEGASPGMRWIAWWANQRSRLARLPYGDQGIFCRRDAYDRSGGFRDLPICDDLDFVLRLRRAGRFVVRRETTVTSPRRYLTAGAARQVLRNWAVLCGYFAGVAPQKLARFYEGR
ncbi:MAG TPA: TIGR04283 family arsenosugar biosynthesis glycosyltransferase [Thermoanaerobaculia bacterium]|nr:TIGR04283 family arsenosugar biosynthesis glycosyltransferase [Thermoanaerobaculia bacterium]